MSTRHHTMHGHVLSSWVLAHMLCCQGASAPPRQPSILLVTLDTTRADHLGPYGYLPAQTPTYDQLATSGTTFLRAYSSCPLTIPSHSTILTGMYPPTHGVRDNGDFILSDDVVLISERLQQSGYRTAAFTSAFPTQARWGFDQGFDVYHDPLEREPTRLDWSDQRRAEDVVTDALAQLERWADDAPAFVWVHLFDAHWPYDPPEPYRSAFQHAPYDGEIAYADAQVGRLLASWDAKFGTESVVLITADHGEGLGDGGEQTHGFLLHDGTTRVPLLLRGPGVAAGAVVDDVVGLVDITPTLLTLAGLPLHDGIQGRDLLHGGSELVYSEALTGQFNLGLSPLHSITLPEGRYMEGSYGSFYPLISHMPTMSTHNIRTVRDNRTALEGYQTTLGTLRAEMDAVIAPTASLTADDLAMLQALGYIGGDATAEAGEIDPRDVIDVIPLTWQIRQMFSLRRLDQAATLLSVLEARMPNTFGVDLLRAQLDQAQGRLHDAHGGFTDLFLRSPSSTTALQLAALEEFWGDWEGALLWYEEALALQPTSPEAMEGQVRVLLQLGQAMTAFDLAEQTLQQYPDHARVRLIRAELLAANFQLQEARQEVEVALQEIPWSLSGRQSLAQIRWALGEPEDAIDLLKETLLIEPYNLPRRMLLTQWFLDVGRNAEAVRTISPLTRLFPDDENITQLSEHARAALDAERRQ